LHSVKKGNVWHCIGFSLLTASQVIFQLLLLGLGLAGVEIITFTAAREEGQLTQTDQWDTPCHMTS